MRISLDESDWFVSDFQKGAKCFAVIFGRRQTQEGEYALSAGF
jgi:hypothetical protein